jgi:hypothetical protein
MDGEQRTEPNPIDRRHRVMQEDPRKIVGKKSPRLPGGAEADRHDENQPGGGA